MSEHVPSVKPLVMVFLALMVLTAITVGVSFINLGAFSAVVALTIAAIKAMLVILFFMEVRYSSKMTMAAIVAGCFFLGLLLFLTMADYISRAWAT